MTAHLTEEVRSESFELALKRGERVVIEANAGAGRTPADLAVSRDGKVITDDALLGDREGQTWLDALVSEDGRYTLIVSYEYEPGSWGDVAVNVWNDRDLPASRTGEYQLALLDHQRAWLVDVSRLQRTGQLVRFPLIEISDDPPKLDHGRIHSTTWSWELDRARSTYRIVAAQLRTVDSSHLPQLGQIETGNPTWSPVPALGRVQPLACDRKPLPGVDEANGLGPAEPGGRVDHLPG